MFVPYSQILKVLILQTAMAMAICCKSVSFVIKTVLVLSCRTLVVFSIYLFGNETDINQQRLRNVSVLRT